MAWKSSDPTEQPLKPFKYTRLISNPLDPQNNKNLRVLHLKGAQNQSEPLSCSIDIVNADKPPKFEALSWNWGHEPHDQPLRIVETLKGQRESVSVKYIPQSLVRALRRLRRQDRSRSLWIDFICINQSDKGEKNEQVPMMAKIYGKARRVCIWLDEMETVDLDLNHPPKRRLTDDSDDFSSDDEEETRRASEKKAAEVKDLREKMAEQDSKAIDFIQEVLKLWKFDELCKNKAQAEDWAALLALMRKPWFSRRWVVQEVALAKHAEIYTEKSKLPWREFVDAVSLFVEVEDATRRLTEIMQQSEVYKHVPDFFEDLSAIGASMLVKATGNLYRGKDKKHTSQKSIEYLVSALSVFDVSDPKDAVYSLLAIAKDTSPVPANQEWRLKLFQRVMAQDKGFKKQGFRVDYGLRTVEVFQTFIQFCIQKSKDPSHALDILCRQWAPDPNPISQRSDSDDKSSNASTVSIAADEKMPSWILGPDQAAYQMYDHPSIGRRMKRINADPLVGLPDDDRPYLAAEYKAVNKEVLKFKKRSSFYSLFVEGFILDKIGERYAHSQNGNIPDDWIEKSGWHDSDKPPPEEFWRTLVADRNHHGRNAPAFFERACHECIKKEGSGDIDTKKLINEGRCSIVAAFLRRVHAVTWNRRMAKSAKTKRLCMTPKATKVNDLICILYGCSVPVVLRPHFMSDAELEDEVRSDEKARNQPREAAARQIAAWVKKKKAAQHSRQNSGLTEDGSGSSPERPRASRASTTSSFTMIDEEVAQIARQEEEEILAKIKVRQSTPPNDPARAYYEFVGPAYVHGFMNGEALEHQNEEGIKPMVFELH